MNNSRPLRILAPYVPTPQNIVERMLELARVGPQDVLYDLGCGDGRICITAASRYGARSVGIDIEPYWIQQCEANAAAAGVSHLTSFRSEDACYSDIQEATVVTLYLVDGSVQTVAREILKDLRPGTRIVSHSFAIRGWEPTESALVPDEEGNLKKVMLWVAGEMSSEQSGDGVSFQ